MNDTDQLHALGYRQELRRSLSVLGNITMGFAVVAPVVALYSVAQVGTTLAGPAWVLTLPFVLLGQLLVVYVYAELVARWPLAGGPYQWGRRLVGPAYGWLGGWVWQFAVMFGNTTVAYLAAPWVFALVGVEPTPGGLVAVAIGVVVLATFVNAYGINVLRLFVGLGIAAEAVASVLVGLALLLVFRQHPFALLTRTLGAEELSGSTFSAFLAVIAVAGWAFIGFDACVSTAEETKDASRQVPRAMWWALLSVGSVVILNAVAVGVAHPDPAAVAAGRDLDPVTTAVVHGFGSWSDKPFVIVVLTSFLACAMASQGGAARGLYSLARDDVFPFARFVKRVNARQAPIGGLVTGGLISAAGLLFGLESSAIGSLISFGTAATFLPFFLVAVAALAGRARGLLPRSPGRTALTVLALLWTGFELVNVWWPREVLAPPGAPWYQVWAAFIGGAVVIGGGLAYLVVRRPQERLAPVVAAVSDSA